MRKNSTNTLGHIIKSMTAQTAVSIRYVKENGEISRRTIEVHSIKVTKAGNITVQAWDRRDNEMTTFRLDRITHYTLHRASSKVAYYALPVAPLDTPDTEVDEYGEVVGFGAWAPYELTA